MYFVVSAQLERIRAKTYQVWAAQETLFSGISVLLVFGFPWSLSKIKNSSFRVAFGVFRASEQRSPRRARVFANSSHKRS